MTTTQTVKTARPLSPHLQVYKPQLTSAMSIFHRFTGIGLWLGLPVLSVWLLALAKGPVEYNFINGLLGTWLGQALLLGWTWALLYHFGNGIRYLILGNARMMTLKFAYASGYFVIAVSFILTAILWCAAYGVSL